MLIVGEGVFRRRREAGLLVFRSIKWDETPFKWSFDTDHDAFDNPVEVIPGLHFSCERMEHRLFIHSRISKKPYTLVEITDGTPMEFPFSVLTVASIQVVGRITAK